MPKRTRKTPQHAPMEFVLMAIGAHADDIELQMGGTVSKYQASGYDIIYVMTTNNMSGGEHAVIDNDDPRPIHIRSQELRKSEANAAARYYGTTAIHLDHPQRHYMVEKGRKVRVEYGCPVPEGLSPEIPCIVHACEDQPSIDRVEALIHEHNPEVIFTHGGPMKNVEHFATQHLVTNAYWQAVEKGYEGMLLNWHDLGVSCFGEAYKHWDTFIDISEFWDEKLHASGIHKTMKPDPAILDWPQNGPMCGCRHAEIFTIVGRNKKPVQYGALTLEILHHEQ